MTVYHALLPANIAIACVGATCVLRYGLSMIDQRRALFMALNRGRMGESPVVIVDEEVQSAIDEITRELSA